MFDKVFFKKIQKEYADYELARREIVKLSGDGISAAKQAIFAFHRNDTKTGKKLLKEVEALQQRLAKKLTTIPGLVWEGSYRAMLEEYVEACLYGDFLEGKPVGAVPAEGIDADAYLGGLMDFTGELVRHAVTEATARRLDEVRRCHQTVEAVAAALVQMNIVGSLRQKYDQTKTNLRKLEEILYNLSFLKSV